MCGEAATTDNRFNGFSENLYEAARILAISITAHRRFVKGDLRATGFDELLQFSAHDRDQRIGDFPTAGIRASGFNSTAERVGPGHAGFQRRTGWCDLLQEFEFSHCAQPVFGNNRSGDRIFPALIVSRWTEAARRKRRCTNALEPSVER